MHAEVFCQLPVALITQICRFCRIQHTAAADGDDRIRLLITQICRHQLHRFHGRFRNGNCARYVKKIDNIANKGNGDLYVRSGAVGKVTVPAPGVKLAPGEISAEITIPYSAFSKKPVPGDVWLFNATAEHQKPGVNFYMVWEHNFDQNTWRNTRDHSGKIQF